MIIGPRAKVILALLLLAVGVAGLYYFKPSAFNKIRPTADLIKYASPAAQFVATSGGSLTK